MILADKIIYERKKNGWSQEELADKLGVTRQAVSKWEGAQTTPDLDRMLKMSRLFGVTVDYLMKDEIEAEEYLSQAQIEEGDFQVRKVSMEEAHQFLMLKKETTPKIALGVALCILSPICLILLSAYAEAEVISLSEEVAVGIGILVLLGTVAMACIIFISCGLKLNPYEFLEKEIIETEYGVTGMVKEKKQQYAETYTRFTILGTVLCIAAVMLLLAGVFFDGNDTTVILCVCGMLAIIAIAVDLFVIAGTTQESFNQLLQEGEYSIKEKKKSPLVGAVSTIYWLAITAIFLILIFFNGKEYRNAGLIWPVAGVIYPAVLTLVKMKDKQ